MKKICLVGAVVLTTVCNVALAVFASNKAYQAGYRDGKDSMSCYKNYFDENCGKEEKHKVTKDELMGKTE